MTGLQVAPDINPSVKVTYGYANALADIGEGVCYNRCIVDTQIADKFMLGYNQITLHDDVCSCVLSS